MIQGIISLFGFVRGLFVAGGVFSTFFTWLSGYAGWIATAFVWLGDLIKKFFVGTGVAFKRVFIYLGAYHAVEVARKLLLIGLIISIFGFVIDYVTNNLLVFDGKTIASLVSDFITSINSFGPLGHNLLAFLSKMGFFECLSLFLTIMIYTLMTRVALTILFK